MTNDGRIIIDVSANTSDYDKSLKEMQTAAKKSAGTTKNHLQSVASGLSSFGKVATKAITVPIAAMATASVAAAVKIDTSLTNVRKTVDGTEEQYQQLKQAAIDFSKVNAVSADQILDIQSLGAQLGYTIDELQMFGEVVSGLDIATNMDAETAGTELAQFANITKMAHKESSNYASTLVALGNTSATTESDISHMAMRIAAAGTQVGMSQAEILGLAAALSSMGIEAEAGGTAISTIMAQIDKDIATNSEDVATWAKVAGMSAKEFAKAWKAQPVEALTALLTHMDSATQAGGNMSVMLQELGIDSIRQTDVMKRLAGNSELVGKTVTNANQAWTENTALSAEVANRNDSLAAKFEMLKNRGVAMLEQVGKPTADALLDIADAAEPVINTFADLTQNFADADKDTQQMILGFAGVAAAIGPVSTVTGKVLKGFDKLSSGIKQTKNKLSDFASSVTVHGSSFTKYIKTIDNGVVSYKKFDKVTQSYVTTSKTLGTTIATSTVGLKAQSVAQGASNTAMNVGSVAARGLGAALKTIAPLAIASVAIGAFTQIAGSIEESRQKTETMRQATDGLRNSMSAVAAVDISSTMETNTESVEQATKSMDDLIQAQADFATESTKTWGDINGKSAAVLGFANTISELANKSELSSEEQAKLAAAVAGYNEITGQSVQITDLQNGKLNTSTESIMANAEAWKRNAEQQALQQELVTLYTNLHEQQVKYTEAEKQAADAAAELNSLHEQQLAGVQGLDAAIVEAAMRQEEANKTMDESKRLMDEANTAIDQRCELLGKNTIAQQGLATSMQEWITKNQELNESLSDVDLEGFTEKLSALGFSTADLEKIGTENIQTLAHNFDGSLDSIVRNCDSAGIQIPGKISNGIYRGAGGVYVAADSVAAGVLQKLTGKDYTTAGGMVTQGMAQGIEGDLSAALAAEGLGEDVIQAIMDAIDAHSPSRKAEDAGEYTGEGMANGIDNRAGNASSAASKMGAGVINALNSAVKPARATGSTAGSSFASGVSSQAPQSASAGTTLGNKAADGLKTILNQATTIGGQGGGNFASGVGNKRGDAKARGNDVANNAATGMKSQNGNASTWGKHLVSNFASGMSGAQYMANNAANTIAGSIAKILGHTVPKEGVLRAGGKGEALWGAHLVDNFASGMIKELPVLNRATDDMAIMLYRSIDGLSLPNIQVGADLALNEKDLNKTFEAMLDEVSVASIIGGDLGIQGLISKVDLTNQKLDAANRTLDRINTVLNEVSRKLDAPQDLYVNNRELGRLQRGAR